jgi:hypothetical protein
MVITHKAWEIFPLPKSIQNTCIYIHVIMMALVEIG